MLRKETIERLFGSAKEQYGFRYTQYIGNVRMNMKTGLTFACMNLKKLAKIPDARERQDKKSGFFFILYKKTWDFVFWKKINTILLFLMATAEKNMLFLSEQEILPGSSVPL